MKRPWARSEKALFLTPLLVLLGTAVLYLRSHRLPPTEGWTKRLSTPPTTQLLNMALSRDGSILVATGEDTIRLANHKFRISPTSGTVYVWDARSLLPLKPFAAQQWTSNAGFFEGYRVYGLSLSPDGKLIGMSGRGAKGFAVSQVQSQRLLWRSPQGASTSKFSADGRHVILDNFEIREAQTGKLLTHWAALNGSDCRFFRLSPDEKTLAWIGEFKMPLPATGQQKSRHIEGQLVEIRRVRDGKLLRVLKDSEGSVAAAFSPDGTKIVTLTQGRASSGADDGSTISCYSSNGSLLWQRNYRDSNPRKIRVDYFCDASFSPDGTTIVVRSYAMENRLTILDASNGHEKQHFMGPKDQSTRMFEPPALFLSPDGKRAFTLGANEVLVWKLK